MSRSRLSLRRLNRQRNRRPYSVPYSASEAYRLHHYAYTIPPIDHNVLSGLLSYHPYNHLKANMDSIPVAETPPIDLKTSFNWPEPTMPRSRSLDEVDFAKLCIAESNAATSQTGSTGVGHDHQRSRLSEKREMDSVSQHFRNLQVQ